MIYLCFGISCLCRQGICFSSLPTSNNLYHARDTKSTKALLSKSEQSWNSDDNWDDQSWYNPLNSNHDASEIFNVDPAMEAARDFESQLQQQQQSLSYSSDDKSSAGDDDFISDALDTIHSRIVERDSPALYDTTKSFDQYIKTTNFVDEMGKEISLLVRCNEAPHQLLVETGRMLPPISEEDLYHVKQLLDLSLSSDGQEFVTNNKNNKQNESEKPTDFFNMAIKQIFDEHSASIIRHNLNNGTHKNGQIKVFGLTSSGIASWMTKSLNEKVGRHDKRVNIILAKYSSHGTGYLTESQFIQLYVDAATRCKPKHNSTTKRGKVSRNKKQEEPTIQSVWRDLKNHGILPPIMVERDRMQQRLDEEFGVRDQNAQMDALDECEILEWNDDEHSSPRSSSTSQMEGSDSGVKKSSHELVQLASDGKTPSRLRDGDFIFIDEESCIGCRQCCNVAPSSFRFLENGRARTFLQSNMVEVNTAVGICPVACMHRVSFDELVEMETARDVGMQSPHIPLNVARINSDRNRQTSSYHSLKHKCFTSNSCPQKGCYDCPMYNRPGSNPYFNLKHKVAERIRAEDIMISGEADNYRNKIDL